MKISEGYKANFETLRQAFANGDVALLDCMSTITNKPVAVICAVNRDGKNFELVPVAKLFDVNPYEELLPPNPDGGYFSQEDSE